MTPPTNLEPREDDLDALENTSLMSDGDEAYQAVLNLVKASQVPQTDRNEDLWILDDESSDEDQVN